MKAYYYGTGKTRFLLINETRYPVAGKREAKQLAQQLGATPWNF